MNSDRKLAAWLIFFFVLGIMGVAGGIRLFSLGGFFVCVAAGILSMLSAVFSVISAIFIFDIVLAGRSLSKGRENNNPQIIYTSPELKGQIIQTMVRREEERQYMN